MLPFVDPSSSVDARWVLPTFLTVLYSAAANAQVQGFVRIYVFTPLGTSLRVGLLGHMVTLGFTFEELQPDFPGGHTSLYFYQQ